MAKTKFDINNTYWNNNGKYEDDCTLLEAVSSDDSDDIYIRAFNALGTIYYHAYNDGYGWNIDYECELLRDVVFPVLREDLNHKYLVNHLDFLEKKMDKLIEIAITNAKFEYTISEVLVFNNNPIAYRLQFLNTKFDIRIDTAKSLGIVCADISSLDSTDLHEEDGVLETYSYVDRAPVREIEEGTKLYEAFKKANLVHVE
jgi:hypothetical protein